MAEHPWSAGSLLATEMTCRCTSGKRPAVGRIAGHLEGREGAARHSGFAITRPCGDCSRAHRNLVTLDGSSGFSRKTICIRLASPWGVEPARKRDSSFSRPSKPTEILGENGDDVAGFLAGDEIDSKVLIPCMP